MGRPVQLKDATLEDKYTQASGRVYLTGMQALVRLPLLQAALDRRAGLNTAGFITGYRGSPLGGYDAALKKAAGHLSANNVHFQPGINEDLAATTIWGTQQVSILSEKQVDGVFGIWYGKGPGVDRSVDVLKHANAAGTSKFGGVVAIMGDDHGCQSSTLPHQSEQVMMAAMIPVLNPSDLQEHIDYGLLGFALSRYSGCWVGLKATTEIIETSATVDVSPDRLIIQEPADLKLPEGGVSIRWPDPPLDQERRLHGPKMDAVLAFARANAIDRRVLGDATAKLGIVASGKAYGDVVEALHALGIGDTEAKQLGISVYKVGMSWPLESEGIAGFASQLDELLVVEEKRGFLEDQIARILYNLVDRPVLSSKLTSGDAIALPSFGEITPGLVADVIVKRLKPHSGPVPELESRARQMNTMAEAVRLEGQSARAPFFCSGCPHNTSTNVPEGSRAMAGIGCHGMAYSIPERRTSLITQMGGEGATWIGQAPFTSEGHVFQNMGDGTYMHSGLLAIRAAAAAGVNITYKILFNDAVAMTGGQEHDGELTVPLITRQVAAEGAKKIYVVSDEPEKYESRAGLASGVKVHHRDDLTAIQKELRDTPGVTVLVYDQTCAAEKRRRRKRGTFADPDRRVFINHRVCEGCGDCSVKSNCISVRPKETEYGRKRKIDQSSCNKDFSCLNGFCPSFVTVKGARLKKRARTKTSAWQNELPYPQVPAPNHAYNILITGIGGTGVVTIGALLGMAAHLENKGVTVLDETGLAQKNGGVTSHVRIAPTQDELRAARIGAGSADLLLACDLVVAASPACNSRLDAERTWALINETVTPTAAFVRDGAINLSAAADRKALSQRLGQSAEFVRASELAVALMGDSIATNLFMLGYAWQKGVVPLSFDAIDRAIELNAVAIEANRQAFQWGRSAAHDLHAVNELALGKTADSVEAPFNVDVFIKRRCEDLTAYQDEAYAKRYADMLKKVKAAETRLIPGQARLTEAVARNYYKLMAYKDEYEVARLYTDGDFLNDLKAQFDGDLRVTYHLAPPVFSRRDRETGELKKSSFGPWVRFAFRLLTRLKGLRGGPFDIFGWTAERRMERQLIAQYEAMLAELLDNLTTANMDIAIDVAAAPSLVKGYGHVKERNAAVYREEVARLLEVFRNPETRKRLAI
ncbi:indolepyruvate ferredoxin oxidoreductase family protein [Henriciella mobilis]|uniref:Indolepyruvate ferredoxin oxidoreductase family protein n=1 Tax=Henriciella mobilis TaxID=2305467 RepID=A0A399R5F5_9PROT|nr:indolepyruvate ferredoxin oxidoreductase family protein [Henriciella mobilis]RIJ26846.1 indolepyruvate ferredoxin oxidoreductase family protein [Henriciella mobilis]